MPRSSESDRALNDAHERRLSVLADKLSVLEEGERRRLTLKPEHWDRLKQLVADRCSRVLERKESGKPSFHSKNGSIDHKWYVWLGDHLRAPAEFQKHGLTMPPAPDDFPKSVIPYARAALQLLDRWETYGCEGMSEYPSGLPKRSGLSMTVPPGLLGVIAADPSQVEKTRRTKKELWAAQVVGYYAAVMREWWSSGNLDVVTPEMRKRLKGHIREDSKDEMFIIWREEPPSFDEMFGCYRGIDPWLGTGMDNIRESEVHIDSYPATGSKEAKMLRDVLRGGNEKWYRRFCDMFWKPTCDLLNESAISACTHHTWLSEETYNAHFSFAIRPTNQLPCAQRWRTLWFPWIFDNYNEKVEDVVSRYDGVRGYPQQGVPMASRIFTELPYPKACFVDTDRLEVYIDRSRPKAMATNVNNMDYTVQVPAWRIWDPVVCFDELHGYNAHESGKPVPCTYSMNWVRDLGLCIAAAKGQEDTDPRCYTSMLEMAKAEHCNLVQLCEHLFGMPGYGYINDMDISRFEGFGELSFVPLMEGKFQYGEGHNPAIVWPDQKQWPGQLKHRRWKGFRQNDNEAVGRLTVKLIGTDNEGHPQRIPDNFETVLQPYDDRQVEIDTEKLMDMFFSDRVYLREGDEAEGEG
jgi:hypothetical protein